ncbi:MAG TPA: (d)CMP kinase [bacterium]|nr:(d)CMP kinase [bacterium]HOG44543.1 (d)CMP kinase [bacterium]HPY13731.1 (d)CMP kinase [bacterium]
MKKIRIAIDGPAGAGKSSVSRMVAGSLGYQYVDTGAIYRSLAYAMNETVKLEDHAEIRQLLDNFDVSFRMKDDVNHIFLNGEDITPFIRTEKVSMLASSVSALPFVREALLEMQKRYARAGGVVMEGRDIGTVIIPDAELKIFLTASPEKRAARRMLELKQKGVEITMENLVEEIKRRDDQDSKRAIAPLKIAVDGVLVDNSDIDLFETAELIVKYAREREKLN